MSTQRTSAHVEDTVREFWAHRPIRPRGGRWFAGVAVGIARRYGIDPVIVRVVLVISTFYGGVGLLFYLLGWLFLPKEGDQVSAFEGMAGRGRSSVGVPFTAVLCLALIPASSFVLGGHITQLVGAAMLLAALYLLHRSRSGYVPPPADTPPTADDTEVGSMSPGAAGDSQQTEQQQRPPNWDPLGAAPFAWDLPEPGPAPGYEPPPPPPPAPRRRSRVGLVTTGCVLVTLGVIALLEPYTHGWLGGAHVLGIITGIVGIGLVGGAMVRAGRWLIVPALLLSLVSVGLTLTGNHGDALPHFGPGDNGDVSYTPTTIDQVRPSYNHSFGDMTIDLTRLPNSGAVVTNIQQSAGDVTVRLPQDADVTVHCHSRAGDMNCLGQQSNGLNNDVTTVNTGPDGPGGLQISMDINMGTGDLEVVRGE